MCLHIRDVLKMNSNLTFTANSEEIIKVTGS